MRHEEAKLKVLITGGSSGIGKDLARAFLARGDEVVIVAESRPKLEAARAELSRISPKVEAIACDVSDRTAVQAMVESVLASGCPDVLVNNAGFAVYRSFEQSSIEEIEKLVDVNLLGTLRCIHGFLPAMMARRSGHIVNVASAAGLMPITPCGAYGAAKHGMVGISEALRFEVRDFGIQLHLICPGRVQTPFFDHETFRRRRRRPEMEKTIPIEAVSACIVAAIEKNRFLTVVPRTLGFVIWARRVFPALFDLLLGRVLVARVREVRSSATNTKPSL